MVTGSNGPSVVTIVAANPTPLSGGSGSDLSTSQFFRNKGAVAGVFLIVGLAAASILLFLFFFVRRRRRTRKMEHDTAVATTLAAAGFNRTPLDGDDEEGGDRNMSQRRGSGVSTNPFRDTVSSLPSATGGRPPSGYMDDPVAGPEAAHDQEFDPYAAFGTIHPPPPATLGFNRKDGYAPARTSSPPPNGAYMGTTGPGHRSYSSRSESTSSAGFGHMARESASSHDLLLGGMRSGSESATPAMPSPALNSSSGDMFSLPPRNPQRLARNPQTPNDEENDGGVRDSITSSVYSMADEGAFDELLASKPTLEVRNLPDGVSVGGDISREPSRRE